MASTDKGETPFFVEDSSHEGALRTENERTRRIGLFLVCAIVLLIFITIAARIFADGPPAQQSSQAGEAGTSLTSELFTL